MVAHRRLTGAEENEVCSLYSVQQHTLRELASRYGLSPAGVRKILMRNNIVRREAGPRRETNP